MLRDEWPTANGGCGFFRHVIVEQVLRASMLTALLGVLEDEIG